MPAAAWSGPVRRWLRMSMTESLQLSATTPKHSRLVGRIHRGAVDDHADCGSARRGPAGKQTPLTTTTMQTDAWTRQAAASSDLLVVNNRQRLAETSSRAPVRSPARRGSMRELGGSAWRTEWTALGTNASVVIYPSVRSFVRSCWRHINVSVSHLGRFIQHTSASVFGSAQSASLVAGCWMYAKLLLVVEIRCIPYLLLTHA